MPNTFLKYPLFYGAGLNGELLATNNLSDLGSASTARTNLGLGTAATYNVGTTNGTIPVLGASGLLATSMLPALAINTVNVVGSQAAMLALTAEQGDAAIRTDENKTYLLATNSPSTLADWKEVLSPTGGGDALVANPLSQFAATTSAELAGVISDETGTGALVFANTPTLVTPAIGAATGTSLVTSGKIQSTAGPLIGGVLAAGNISGATSISVTGCNTIDATLTGNVTGFALTGGVDGQRVLCRFRQDGTGNRTIAFGSGIRFNSTLTGCTLSTAANKLDLFFLIYDATDSKWDFCGGPLLGA